MKKKLSPEEKQGLKVTLETKLGEKIKDHVFDRFSEDIEEIALNRQDITNLAGRMLAENISAEYETVLYYRFLLRENFSRLITNIDKHVVYGLRRNFSRFYQFNAIFNIELNADFINYLECLSGIGTCTLEFRKTFFDDTFNTEYQKLVDKLPVTNGILSKIRNVYHHARGFRLGEIRIVSQNSKKNIFGTSVDELLNKTDKWNETEQTYLRTNSQDSFIDLKILIIEHFKDYEVFLEQYEKLLEDLVKRKTGHQITIYV
jgi:hypothetical protein